MKEGLLYVLLVIAVGVFVVFVLKTVGNMP